MPKSGNNLGPVDLMSEVLPSHNGIYQNFRNCGISDLVRGPSFSKWDIPKLSKLWHFRFSTFIEEVVFLWNRTVDSLKTSFHLLP